jgi:hypothetical protein
MDESKTPNFNLPLETHGHVALRQSLITGFRIIDEQLALVTGVPPFTLDDAGKVLGVIDDEGTPRLGWIEL